MASKVGYQVILFMRPSDDATAPEPEEHRNSNHDIMDKVELILIQLHGMDSSEVASVKEVLMRAAQRFQDLTGPSRRFILSFQREVSAPNHLSLDSGSGLIYLFKWIVQDQLEMSNLEHLLPHDHDLCANGRKGLISRSQLISSTCLDELKQLVVYEIALCEIGEGEGDSEITASFGI